MGLKHLAAEEAGRVPAGPQSRTIPKWPRYGPDRHRGRAKMPKALQMVIAQLAFANSDLAFQGNSSVPGKFLRNQYLRYFRSGENDLADHPGLPRRTGRRLGLQEFDVHVGGNAERAHRLRRAGISAGTSAACGKEKRSAVRRRRKTTVSAASEFSTSRTSRIRSRWPRCRPAADRTRTRWWWTPTTRTTFTFTFRERRLCARAKNWRDARAKRRTRIRTPRCSAST